MKIRVSNLYLFVVMSIQTSLVVWGAEEKNRIFPEADAIITTTTPVRSAMPRAPRHSQASIPQEQIRVSGTTIAPRDGVFRRLDVDTLVVKKEISVTDFVITGTFFAGNIVAAGTLGGSQLTINGPATISGPLTVGGLISGNLLGNVTGNVAGNLLGDVTGNLFGNVIGNVSGASSLNVLKAGDTMTGALRINNATAPALQLETNATAATNDFVLAIDGSGNVTKSTVQIGSLGSSGTSSNVPGTLVQRDVIDGGFSAGTITALGLLSNLTGNVSGTVTGGLIGNVTGNVFGNVLGDITGNVHGNLVGNVIGNVSGASSLNVLKAGDTMTGQLRVSTSGIEPAVVITGQGVIAAPALQLLNNPPALVTDTIVGIDALGNITQSTIPIGTIAGGTSGNVPNTLILRDGSGNFAAGTIYANLIGDISGTLNGNISGAASLNVLKSGDAMSGPLNMTTNNITNVGTVNGVTVQAHAARHLPSGADPLAVGIPVTIQTVNFIGVANSFSRSDHVHAHGTQSDPSLHVLATDVQAGFMDPADKLMLMNATSGNVPNTLVLRDDSGNFTTNVLNVQGLDVVGTSTFNGQVYNFFASVSPNNVLYVQKGPITAPNQFNSVKTAVDSIVGSSAVNPFVVSVAPGIYIEDTITMKPYVGIIGVHQNSVVIQVNATNKDVIHGSDNAYLKGLTLQGATDPGMATINQDGGALSADSMNLGSSDILVKMRASTTPGIVSLTNINVFGTFTTGFDTNSTAFLPCGIAWSSLQWSPTAPMSSSVTFANIQGPGAYIFAGTINIGSTAIPPTAGTVGIRLTNGGFLQMATGGVAGFDTAFSVPSGAFGTSMTLLGVKASNNNTDISIQDQSIHGTISGEFDRTKVIIDPAVTGLSLFFTNGGITLVGEMFAGKHIGYITNISPAINDGTNLGMINGGLIYTTTTSLVVTVSAGTGYLMQTADDGDDHLKFVEWLTTTTLLPPNTDSFVYIDNTGKAQASLSQTDLFTTIPIGKVRTNTGGALFIEQIPEEAAHTATKLTESFIEALGPIYISGSIVEKNGIDGLSVPQGKYAYGTQLFQPVGNPSLSWQAYLGAGANEFIETQTAVDYQHFDNNGALDLIPTGSYAKHLLYVIGGVDPVTGATNEQYALVYSQTIFQTLSSAEIGSVPMKPSTWTGNIVPLASIIVQNNGAVQIVQVLDERPRPGFVSSSVAGVTVHGDLQGLGADDHTQYVLTNGGRLMTGSLQMGSNNITFAGSTLANGLVDNVKVSKHGSRHQPNSVDDPLAVGADSDIQNVGLANFAGDDNLFVRANHIHAHSNLPGGGLHALVTTVTAGFMSNTDYIALTRATPANTPGAIVTRDASGNFTAGTITAGLIIGNVSGSMSGNLTVPAGSAAAPSIAFSGNTNTGIYSPGTNQVALTTNGTERFAVGATGTVTIAGLNSAGVVHTDGSGNLSTSLIVNNDITNGTIANSKLATATSSNTPGYLVLRDAQGNFAAGVITATGGFIGNLTGNVAGNVFGNLTGNVYGNVEGNLSGNVTGNVTGDIIGNVSGAASLNVLKAGDTMTGTLRVTPSLIAAAAILSGQGSTLAPALRLFNNVPATDSDKLLAIDGSGNISETTVPVGLLTNATSGSVPNTLVLRDGAGSFAANAIRAQGLDVIGTATFNSQVYNFFASVSPNNVLYVQKGPITAPNQFNSVKAAVDTITTNTDTNRFVVSVAPGIYTEDTITMKPYVGILGINESSVVIQVNATNKDVIHGCDNAFLKGLTLQGATDPGMAAISIDGGMMSADNMNFGSSDILMKIRATSSPSGSTVVLANVLGTGVFTTAFDIQSNDFPGPIYPCGLVFSSLTWSPSMPMASTVTFAKVYGPGAYLVGGSLSAGSFSIPPTTGTKFLDLYNGGFVEIATASINGFDTAFSASSGAIGSTLILLAIATINNNTDISVQDQQLVGSISGEFNRAKISIDPAATGLSLFLTDGGITSVGSLYAGRSIGTITNISPAINYGTNLGVITGGEMYTNPASLVLTVSAGQGYLMQTNGAMDDLKLVEWATTQTVLIPNIDNYVYMDNAGLPNVSLSASSLYYTIPLGKARGTASSPLYLQEMLQDATHTATKLADILELAFGPVYVTGSNVSKNGTVQLDVTAGQYTIGERIFAPVGGTAITWEEFFGSGTNLYNGNQSSINYQQYDNGGVLASIPVGQYAKHMLYVIGGFDADCDRVAQAFALVYSQTYFSTLNDALNGPVPQQPASWTGNIVPLASIIVSNTPVAANRIAQILDQRPRPGFVPSSVAGVSVHGNLSGLLADDHPQYLLTNGGRAMTGNLQMGTNSISNVGTVNGVTVELHGARHGANNLDPIPTGVLADIQQVGLTNAAGASNAFPRADHVHAHGDLPGGSLHAVATTVAAGFMSAADKAALVGATPVNTPSTIVMRDAQGNFTAGTITAGLLGNVTGNVVGNLSGAASANVLKIGDTMTGELRISDPTLSPLVITGNATTPAVTITGGLNTTTSGVLRLVNIPTIVTTDSALAVDVSGNVTKSGIVTINGVGAVTHGAGTAALPSITFSGNTNTGLYSPTTNNVALTTNGFQRLLVDMSGAVTINAPTANVVGLTVTGNTIGASGAAVINQGNNAASGSALIVNAAVNAASSPAVRIVGAANAADIMTITGAAGAGATGRGLVIDKSQASSSGVGLQVTGNTNSPATLITGNSTTLAPALRLAGVPSLPAPSLTFNTTGYALTTDVTGNVMQSLGNNGETFRTFFSQPNWYRSIDPRREMTFYDDFMGAFPVTGNAALGGLPFGDTQWKQSTSGANSSVTGPTVSSDAFGIVRLAIGNNGGGYAIIAKNVAQNIAPIYFGLGKFVLEMRVNFDQTTTDYTFRIGLGGFTIAYPTASDFSHGVYFEYTPATSANWLCKTASGGTPTTVDSGIVATANTWHTLRIEVNETGTAVNYYVDDVLVTAVGTPITTNIPVTAGTACGPIAQLIRTTATALRNLNIDYWYQQYVFNTVR